MATIPEIAVSLTRLRDALPAPRGIKADKAFDGYVTALQKFAIADIDETIDRYLSAEFDEVSLKYYPRAPELAGLVRRVLHLRSVEADKQRRIEAAKKAKLELDEADKIRFHTPEQKAHVQSVYDGFIEETQGARLRRQREEREAARADVRSRYGMTDEVLATVKDRPLPKGMKPLGEAAKRAVMPKPEPPKNEDLKLFGES